MKRNILIILTSFILLATSHAHAQEKVEWAEANELYASGNYEEALKIYHTLETTEGVGAELYYNIGNCYFKSDKLANAILYFNRALRLEPSNDDIKHNLQIANTLTTSKIKEVPVFFLNRWYASATTLMNSNTWTTLTLLFFALCVAMVVVFVLSRSSSYRKVTFSLAVATLMLALFAYSAAVHRKNIVNSETEAIIMNNAVAVKSSPDSSGKDIFILNQGVKVDILEKLSGWRRISVSSGDSGWVKTENMEVI